MSTADVVTWIAHHKLISLASIILLMELGFRRWAPTSAAYARWTSFFQALGAVWTAVLLSVIYVLSVGPVSLGMRLMGKDLLDRSLAAEGTFWRRYEANPLGASSAVRHQF